MRTAVSKKQKNGASRKRQQSKLGHVLVFLIDDVQPSPENSLYRPVVPDDPEIVALAESMRKYGQLEDIRITQDNFILSGHRRHMACKLAGLKTIRCRRENTYRKGNPDFVVVLREYNRQRVKTRDEQIREEVISTNPEEAHRLLVEHRSRASRISVPAMNLGAVKQRCKISSAKTQFLKAVQAVIARLEDFWPVSVRQIHYQLLNDPPRIHSSKRRSRYRNDVKSYKALSDLLTRARYEGLVEFDVIHDPTRPVTNWRVWNDVSGFYRNKMNGLLKGYYRDLLQSQENAIEIMAEKNTLENIIRPIAMEYCCPLTIGRGFCSTPPKRALAKRYSSSGKNKLVLLIVADFDPDGEMIAESFGRSMRDDFGIEDVHAIKVACTFEQITEFALPKSMNSAKPGSPNYHKFVAKYGTDAYEVEAIPPETLQTALRSAIDSVLDVPAFNFEIDAEKKDAAHLAAVRRNMFSFLGDLGQDE